MSADIFTIGHSTQSIGQFVQRLQAHGITAVADVRSAPYSRHNPQFNRESLRSVLKEAGIKYVFLGRELGARSDDECCYVDDKVQYAILAQTELFKSGISRVIEGATTYKIALMCAESEPLECHRTILVARELTNRGRKVNHILVDGSLEAHPETISRLVERLGLETGPDMFRTRSMAFEDAYEKQSRRIAYDRKSSHMRTAKDSESLLTESGGN
jgi:uncharacterized protein (DUF488 family)